MKEVYIMNVSIYYKHVNEINLFMVNEINV